MEQISFPHINFLEPKKEKKNEKKKKTLKKLI
jgi:hypothetical protein